MRSSNMVRHRCSKYCTSLNSCRSFFTSRLSFFNLSVLKQTNTHASLQNRLCVCLSTCLLSIGSFIRILHTNTSAELAIRFCDAFVIRYKLREKISIHDLYNKCINSSHGAPVFWCRPISAIEAEKCCYFMSLASELWKTIFFRLWRKLVNKFTVSF